MKKYSHLQLKNAKEIIQGIRGDSIDQFYKAKDETNLSKQIKCLDYVTHCDELLKVLSHISAGHSVVRQLS